MKRKISLLLAMVMCVSTLVACGKKAEEAGTADDTVVVYTADIFNTMNPYETTANSDQSVFDQVYETLTVTQDDGTVAPCLAREWTVSEDCLEYVFHLEEGVKFHNGETLTAGDVVFSMEQYLANPAKNNFVNMIEAVEAVDANTVRFVLDKVTPLFLVSTNELPILSEKFVTEKNGDISEAACGTGPYRLTGIDLATAAMLERNEDYRLGPAAISKVELRYIGDKSTAAVQLETGDIDVMRMDPSQLVNIEGSDKFTVETVQTLKTAILAINTTVAPLDNKLVRQAMSYAVDKNSIIMVAYEGYAAPARLQASDANCFGVDFSDAEDFSYNPEKARQLLSEAGYPNGLNFADFGIQMDILGGTYMEKAAQVMQQNFMDVGIKIELRNTSTPDEDAESGNFALMTQTLSYRADFSYNVCHYGSIGIGGNNFCQMRDPWVDEMFAKAESEQDPEARKAVYRELITYLVDYCPSIPLFHHELVYVWNSRLNATVHDSSVHPYYCYEWSWKS